jgi:hypothetical protein
VASPSAPSTFMGFGTNPALSRSMLSSAQRRLVTSGDCDPKALIFALLFAGLPVAAYADGAGGAVGAIVRAPGETAAGIVGGLTGTEAPRFHHYIREHNVPSYTWAEGAAESSAGTQPRWLPRPVVPA